MVRSTYCKYSLWKLQAMDSLLKTAFIPSAILYAYSCMRDSTFKGHFFFFSMILLYQVLPELHARTSFYLHKNQRWPWKVNETNWGKIATAACWEKTKCYLKTISSKAIPSSALHYCLLPWDSQSILGKTWASVFFLFSLLVLKCFTGLCIYGLMSFWLSSLTRLVAYCYWYNNLIFTME